MATEVKAAKKVAAKKSTPKKVIAKKTKRGGRPLQYADNQRSFWVSNGEVLNSLVALNNALASMEKAVFAHHVSKDKNDFADWVETVLNDLECANALRKTATPAAARTVVIRYLKQYDV